MMEWTDTGWPDWCDSGNPIEMVLEDGQVIDGRLAIDDFFFDGEEEVPVFTIIDAYGESHSLTDGEKWRFTA